MLQFVSPLPADYDRIYAYTSRYGEGSCQHSPVSMYSLSEKYGDKVCEKDGFLYTLRSHLCNEDYCVYLAPLGGGDMKEAYSQIISDAHAFGKKVRFSTLTMTAASALKSAFPDLFDIREDRDSAEYIHRTDAMATFAGNKLRKQRNEVNAFRTRYGDRASVERIRPEDLGDILAFERRWVCENEGSHDGEALRREQRMIEKQLEHFTQLHLSGVVVRIDGVVSGFGYGTALNDDYYDAIAEKGDRNITHIYKVLRRESVRQCALSHTYVNLEEDVGSAGLRDMKMAYRPAFLLRKYIATERQEI